MFSENEITFLIYGQECAIERCNNEEEFKEELARHKDLLAKLKRLEKDTKLYNSDPDCVHDTRSKGIYAGGGVKCSKCTGWFCY